MKRIFPLAIALLAAGSIMAADSSPKDEVIGAAKKLAGTDNYSWKTTVEVGGGGRFRPGPTDGKTEKDGYTVLDFTMGDNSGHAVLKGDKGAIKMEDDWQSLSDAAKDDGGGGFSPTRFLAMRLQSFKVPAAEISDLVDKSKDLKLADGAYSGEMTEEGAKARLSFGRPGGDGPTISDAKGSMKFWIADGAVTKYEFNLKGHIEFNGNGRDVDRTTKVEIKDVGKTKLEVPDGAKKKIL